ncbi:TFIIH subunit TTDA/Tfb5 [Neohortaea acidophila]|uniref:General transcription and DNA repair factor IIH subunit TFB5 n=1 Tax=Neohortaea acidophila TaxID=245834 RepID=A0A6A6PZ71_9PEZI|nr:TFIIH subunit TTDA/Tfb5 [Neohortaea acidophila]KAF2485066.1 TFIIH subunit TTDA/Tfb5 [Neohortaea acidophila]
MPRAIPGVLVECDASIKAIINRINDQHDHDFIIEDIDDEHVLIKSSKLDELKLLLKDALKDSVRENEDSSESD